MAYADSFTCLDSSFDLESLFTRSRHLKGIKSIRTFVGKGIMLTTRQLLNAERRDRIFFGFDEVWFFGNRRISEKPDTGFWSKGPNRLSAEVVENYERWLRASGCT